MQFDPKDVSFVWAGILVEGWAEGSFIDIDYRNDLWDITTGADGLGAFVKSNDASALVTFRLMPGALVNQALSLKFMGDLTPLNAGFGPLEIFDASTLSSHSALKARLMRSPKRVYGTSVEALEYQLGCLNLVPNNGPAVNPLI